MRKIREICYFKNWLKIIIFYTCCPLYRICNTNIFLPKVKYLAVPQPSLIFKIFTKNAPGSATSGPQLPARKCRIQHSYGVSEGFTETGFGRCKTGRRQSLRPVKYIHIGVRREDPGPSRIRICTRLPAQPFFTCSRIYLSSGSSSMCPSRYMEKISMG